jgi:hypothetical protein
MAAGKKSGQDFPHDVMLANNDLAHLFFDRGEHAEKFFDAFFRW